MYKNSKLFKCKNFQPKQSQCLVTNILHQFKRFQYREQSRRRAGTKKKFSKISKKGIKQAGSQCTKTKQICLPKVMKIIQPIVKLPDFVIYNNVGQIMECEHLYANEVHQ